VTAAPWWLVAPALAAIAGAVILLARREGPRPLPAVDAAAFARAGRRTRLLRCGLVAGIGGVLAAAYLTAPRPTGELSELVSPGRSTVVVLDLSQSVSDLVYREIARTLDGIVTAAGENGRVGLVLFSDTAQEALPPGSRAAELAPFIRYFRPRQERGVATKPVYYRAAGPTEQLQTQYPLNPWYGRFSGGTQISTGLRVARVALAREDLPGRVILLSDLAEADYDLPRLTRELVAYERNPATDLRVVALPPASPAQKALFERITGEPDLVVDSLALATGNQGLGEPSEGLAWPFLAAVLGLAVALGLNELVGVPLSWRARTPEAGA
jgi:hypothetical protein